jgi:hypothetical protein
MAGNINTGQSSDNRGGYAFAVAIIGILVPAILIGYLSHFETKVDASNHAIPGQWDASSITAAAGLFTSIVGTLVGAFLGVQVGAAGKQQAEERAKTAEEKKTEAQSEAEQAKGETRQAKDEAERAKSESEQAKASFKQVQDMLTPEQLVRLNLK